MTCVGGTDFIIQPSNLVQPSCANGNYGSITHTNTAAFGSGPYYYVWLKNGVLLNTGPLNPGDSVTHELIPNENYRMVVTNASTGCISNGLEGSVLPDLNCPVPIDDPDDPDPCTTGSDFVIAPTAGELPNCANNNIGFITHTTQSAGLGVVPYYIVFINGQGASFGLLPAGSSFTEDLLPNNTYQFIFVDPLSNCKSVGIEETITGENNCSECEGQPDGTVCTGGVCCNELCVNLPTITITSS